MTRALSVAMVAERWSCSVNTVYRLIADKKLQAFSAGRNTTRVLVSVVEAYERGEPSWGNGDRIGSASTGLGNSKDVPSPSGATSEASTASDLKPAPRRKGARRSIDTLAAGRY